MVKWIRASLYVFLVNNCWFLLGWAGRLYQAKDSHDLTCAQCCWLIALGTIIDIRYEPPKQVLSLTISFVWASLFCVTNRNGLLISLLTVSYIRISISFVPFCEHDIFFSVSFLVLQFLYVCWNTRIRAGVRVFRLRMRRGIPKWIAYDIAYTHSNFKYVFAYCVLRTFA